MSEPAVSEPGQPVATASGQGVTRLSLAAFRNYGAATLNVTAQMIVLTGPNGAGKTNVLEALSLLTPGRGLRGAPLKDLTQHAEGRLRPWAVAAQVAAGGQFADLGTGLDPDANPSGVERRVARINGATARGVARLGDHIACVWLTPAMDGLFTGGAGDRRRFLDRIITSFDPDHTSRTNAYDQALRQRRKLARDGNLDPAWHAALEDTLARYGVAIAAARADMVARLAGALEKSQGPFPAAEVALDGWIDRQLAQGPALAAEDTLKVRLAEARQANDIGAVIEAAGPHQTDLTVKMTRPDGSMPAALCSTGEQKALLISLVLAHARLLTKESGRATLILLDEIGAHLDQDRRQALFTLLSGLPAQIWMTGTEPEIFDDLPVPAQFIAVNAGTLSAPASVSFSSVQTVS